MKTVTYSDAEIQRLIDGGWKETAEKSGMWLRPEMDARYGGNSTGEALRQQDKLDIIAKYGALFYAQPCRYGFGYWLGIYEGNLEKPRRYGYGFDHLTEQDAKKLVKSFNSTCDRETILGINYKPQKFDLVAILHEKHGDRHFIVHTMQDLEKAALKIALERNEEGWYSFDHELPTEPKMTVEDAKKLGMTGVVAAVEREWSDYKYNKEQYEDGIRLKAALDKIVKNKDGEIALQFLNSMKDGEYERFEVISGEELEQKNMNTEDFEDLFVDVIALLRGKFGEEKLNDWGYLTIKSWCRDALELNAQATASEIATDIWLDWKNERP